MSTGKTNRTSTQFAAKKLLGKAHTNNQFSDVNESIPSNVSVPFSTIFAQEIPNTPPTASFFASGSVEKVHFDVVELSNTIYDANDTDGGGDEASGNGAHGYYLKLPYNYETTSSNPQRGTGSFTNGKRVYDTRGALQLVPPLVSNANPNLYFLKLYKGEIDDANEITSGDSVDWQIDYYSGVIFIQDYNASTVPVSASGYLYIGDYLDAKINEISSSGGGSGTITALNNQAENRLVTIGSTTTELDGEANLTFDGSELILTGSSIFNGALTSSHIVPLQNEQYDLGQVDLKYENLYAKYLDGGLAFTAINNEGDTISRGQVVYIDGISGNTPTVALAAADDASKMPAMGLVADGTSNDGTEVRIVTFGSLNSFDTSAFTEGDTLYVQTGSGETSGSLTNSPPTGSGNLIQNIARVIKADGTGVVRVGGAGRTNATPNLDEGNIFIGNSNNQAVQDNTIFISSSINRVGINTLTPSHTLTVNGEVSASAYHGDGSNLTGIVTSGVSYGRTAVTSTVTASVSDKILGVSASAALEIRLPAAGDYDAGQFFTIKDEGGNANINNITVLASGSEEIDGRSSIILESSYAAINLYSDGTSKFFIY